MELSREKVISKIKESDFNWFYEVYNEYCWVARKERRKNDGRVKVVYDQHWGDGNDYQIALEFVEFKYIVLLDGTYSSWDSPQWDSVSFAKPYTFSETRYRTATLDELRDDKINDVLDN